MNVMRLQLIGLLLCSAIPKFWSVDPHFQLGACYGYFTWLSMLDYAVKIGFEEGYFNDILSTTAFRIDITSVDTLCSATEAAKVSMPLFLGKGTTTGRIYDTTNVPPVIAINGCTCSAASKIFATQAVPFEVPMVSGSSTSPDLTNKFVYKYFARTIPPDSMQARGLGKLVQNFNWKRTFGIHRLGDAFGEGLVAAFCDDVRSRGSDCFIRTVPNLMLDNANLQNFEASWPSVTQDVNALAAETPAPRIMLLVSTQVEWIVYAMNQAGLVSSKHVFLMAEGSCGVNQLTMLTPKIPDFQTASPSNPMWTDPFWSQIPELMEGMGCLVPQSVGPRWNSPQFDTFWNGLTKAKLIAAGYPVHADWKDSWLDRTSADLVAPYMQMHFDGMTALLVAISNMITKGTAPADIKGDALRQEIFGLQFEGISGNIAFDANGDRLAPYDVKNIQVNSGTPAAVTVGVYDGSADSLSFTVSYKFGGGTTVVPLDRPAACTQGSEFSAPDKACIPCVIGRYSPNADSQCLDCPAGTYGTTTGAKGVAECTVCPAGTYTGNNTGKSLVLGQSVATVCMDCPAGRALPAPLGKSVCDECEAGKSAAQGSASCSFCPRGTYMGMPGAAACSPCPMHTTTFNIATESSSDCRCAIGAYSNSLGTCMACPNNSTTSGLDSAGVSSCMCNVNMYMASDISGSSSCVACPTGSTTEGIGKTSISACLCEIGTYRPANSLDACVKCPEGMECVRGSSADNFKIAANAVRSVEEQSPKLLPMYFSTFEKPDSVFRCRDEKKCPGGYPGPGACAAKLAELNCEHCEKGWHWNGERCTECTSMEASQFVFPTIPILIIPIIISCMYKVFGDLPPKWGSWRNCIACIIFIVLNHYQIIDVLTEASLIFPPQVLVVWVEWRFTNNVMTIFKVDCTGYGGFESAMIFRALGPIIIALLCFLTALGSIPVARLLQKPDVAMQRDRMLNVFGSIMFTFFGAIAASSLMLFKCSDNPNGERTLNADMSIICESDDWNKMLAIAIICVLLYCIGMGSLFVQAIIYAPAQFAQSSGFVMRWKFLFIKFRADVFWWGIVFLSKNLLVNLSFVAFSYGLGQLYMTMSVVIVYSGAIIVFLPYRRRVANTVELISSVSILYCASMLTWFAEEQDQYDDAMAAAMIAISFAPIAIGVGACALVAYNGAVLKQDIATMTEAELETIQRSLECLNALTKVNRESLLQRLGEWDQWYFKAAMNGVMAEFLCSDMIRPKQVPVRLIDRSVSEAYLSSRTSVTQEKPGAQDKLEEYIGKSEPQTVEDANTEGETRFLKNHAQVPSVDSAFEDNTLWFPNAEGSRWSSDSSFPFVVRGTSQIPPLGTPRSVRQGLTTPRSPRTPAGSPLATPRSPSFGR